MLPAPVFVCPNCHTGLEQVSEVELSCPVEGLRFPCIDGIWRFLLPGHLERYGKFIREYETIRRAEGRGTPDPVYYRALPYKDLSGKMSADWRIRAASYDTLIREIINPSARALRVLDLGAGNGWLSNRLAGLGHQVLAVDLMTNDFDGLGCRRYYETSFTPIQAEFDWLPCADHSLDLVIFNASLHYSVDLRETLAEAVRVLGRAGGSLAVMDSPVYHDAESGKNMVYEREAQFTQRYGFPSNALKSANFLTYAGLKDLGHELNIEWRYFTPFYGLSWAFKPLKAQLLGRREPARFHIISGRPQV